MDNFDCEMDSVHYSGGRSNGDNNESKRKLIDLEDGSGKEFESKDSIGLLTAESKYPDPTLVRSQPSPPTSRCHGAGSGPGSGPGSGSGPGPGPGPGMGPVSHDGDEDAATLENSIRSGRISCGGDEEVIIDRSPCHSLPLSSQHHQPPGPRDGRPSQGRQILAALAANMGAMALGAAMSWSATALPDLRKSGAVGDIDSGQESWVGSIFTLGAVVACPVAGFSIERFGRRLSMLLLTLPFLGGWLSIFFAQDLTMIYVGRFMTGFCAGGFTIGAPVFITETAEANIRGALTSGFDMMLTVGILYIFLVGTFTSWKIQAFACGLIPLVFHALMTFVPESPRYLVERGQVLEAGKALSWLRSSPPSSQHIQAELADLIGSVAESRARAGTWRDLFTPAVMKPTSIGLALMFFQQLSGIDPVMFYTVDIFHSAGSDIDENLSANIVGAIQVGATVTCALVVDRCGRRPLLVLSAVFMMISLGTMGLYFYLKEKNGGVSPEHLGWLPLSSLMVYVVAFSIGFGPIPWLLVGEIIPSHVKGLAAGFVTMSRWLLGFIVTKVFQNIMDAFGESGGYWFFGSFCLVGSFYVYFFVPETKGKSMDEIQLLFAPNKSQNKGEIDEETESLHVD